MPSLEILYEDNHLLAINKPAGVPTMGAVAGTLSLIEMAKWYLKQRYNKPGQVYLGVVSRLDAPVTGVILFARTSKAAARLTQAFRERSVSKRYWALVWPPPPESSARLRHFLRKDESARRMVVCASDHLGAQLAELSYRRRGTADGLSWLEVELHTGRKHQIRLQLATARCPIAGDRRYGSRRPFPQGIALHARQLELIHPVRRQPLVIVAPPPSYWPHRRANGDAP